MSREFKLTKAPYDKGDNIYSKATFTFEPGITILVGCNGSGKTTLITLLKEKLDINKYNCSIRTIFKVDKDEVKESTTLYNDNVPLTTWNITISKNNLRDVIDDEYYSRFYKLERC